MTPLLEAEDLSIAFTQYDKGLRQRTVTVVQGISLSVEQGEVMAVIGSSGAGKSLLAHAILGILPSNASVSGRLRFQGEALGAERQAKLRGKQIALIPQSVGYLNPLMRAGAQVREAAQRLGDAKQRQRTVFRRYGLEESAEKKYPFELSGGMARRVLAAAATVGGAQLYIADEPTAGLDAGAVNETMSFFRELADAGNGVLLITHDIAAALIVADRIAVLYAGTVLEIAQAADFKEGGSQLRHPYSQALCSALPQNEFLPLPGAQPQPESLPRGCLFAPRCSLATDACHSERPETRPLRGGLVRCIHAT